MPSKQETFDIVAKHLLTQNQKSMAVVDADPNLVCAYRGNNGCKCAAGILIPDAKYDPAMENGIIIIATDLYRTTLISSRLVTTVVALEEGHDAGLVRGLQQVHDLGGVSEWRNRLELVAGHHALNTNVLDQVPA